MEIGITNGEVNNEAMSVFRHFVFMPTSRVAAVYTKCFHLRIQSRSL